MDYNKMFRLFATIAIFYCIALLAIGCSSPTSPTDDGLPLPEGMVECWGVDHGDGLHWHCLDSEGGLWDFD